MEKYQKNEIVMGMVTGIEKYGIFVSLDEYYSGLIHISEISDDYVKNINNYVDMGETIRVRVLDSEDDTYHVKLSIKNLDYHVKSSHQKIKETGSGFEILRKSLDNWIEKKNGSEN